MSALSNYLEDKWLRMLSGATAFTAPATHVALFTTIPAEDGTGGTEVSGGSYARKQVNQDGATAPYWNAPAQQADGAALIDNNGAITWAAATANWGEIVAVGIYDAASGGNLLYRGFLEAAAQEFTALASSDVITSYGHGYADGDRVIVRGAQLPTGLSAETIYYVRDATTDTFKLAATSGGAAIDLTANGEGRVSKITPKTVGNGDTFEFASGALDLTLG